MFDGWIIVQSCTAPRDDVEHFDFLKKIKRNLSGHSVDGKAGRGHGGADFSSDFQDRGVQQCHINVRGGRRRTFHCFVAFLPGTASVDEESKAGCLNKQEKYTREV